MCLCTICNAQVKFIGSVKLHNGSPVENAIIIAKIPSEKGERIVANTRTDEQGHYAFTLSNSSPQIVLYISNFNIKPIRKEIANISQNFRLCCRIAKHRIRGSICKTDDYKCQRRYADLSSFSF